MVACMFFGVLGSVGAWTDDGRPVPVPGAKVRVLLAALLAAEGRVVTADHLIDALWDDVPPGDPYGTLSGKFTQLRRALDTAEPGARRLVESPPPGYRLRLGDDGLDVQRFRALVQRARAPGDGRRRAELLCDALALWRGPAFADVADCGFARASVARLTEERLVAMEEYAEARLALGEDATVVAELAGLIAENPLRERLRAAHILALYRSGRQSDALASYADLHAQLADELGLEPSDELASLQSAVLSRDPALELQPAPAPASRIVADRPRTNLPATPGTLIGRADAVAAIRSRLASERLVTLVGPGGVGKTRLAVQAAADSAEAFHEGVWLAELAELAPTSTASPADVVRAALGVRDAGTSAEDGLVAALRAGTSLLVLDNCEHVVDQVTPLVDRLLRSCPGLRILATSREPLGATGEVLVDVPPLAVPSVPSVPARSDDRGDPAWLAQLADFPAVHLFIARASAASPGFALDATNAHAVVEVCRRLDGLPLALELAANRVRALGVHELAKRLDDRFRLLDVGPRGAPLRQRSLGAVIDWSWELLPEPERVVLRRIAVFIGGCTLEAAEAVCDGDVLDALSRLVDRSFLEVTHSPDGPRYRLLESLAAYGRDRLAESGEAGPVWDRYVTYYSALAERADGFLRGRDQQYWLRRLDAETANLRTAVDVALQGDADRASRLVTALTWYWFLRGRLAEAHRALSAAVGVDGPVAPVLCDTARDLLAAVGLLLGEPGPPAPPWHADTVERARSQWFLAYAESDFGDVSAVQARLDAALASFSDSGDDWGIAAALSTKAKLAQVRTDRTLLARDAARSDALFRAVGDRWGRLQATMWLSGLAEMRGDYDRAARLNADGLRMAEELDLWPDVASRTGWAGWIAMQQRDYGRGLELCVEARRLAREQGYQVGATLAGLGLAFAARRLGDHDEAETQLRGLLEAAGDWDGDQPPPLHLPLVLSELGFLLHQDDRFDEAADLHRQAFAAARTLDNARSTAIALEGLAGALTGGDHYQTSAVLLGTADAVRQAASTPRSPGDQDDVDRIADAIRAALSRDEIDAAHRRGSRLTPEEARALAG